MLFLPCVNIALLPGISVAMTGTLAASPSRITVDNPSHSEELTRTSKHPYMASISGRAPVKRTCFEIPRFSATSTNDARKSPSPTMTKKTRGFAFTTRLAALRRSSIPFSIASRPIEPTIKVSLSIDSSLSKALLDSDLPINRFRSMALGCQMAFLFNILAIQRLSNWSTMAWLTPISAEKRSDKAGL